MSGFGRLFLLVLLVAVAYPANGQDVEINGQSMQNVDILQTSEITTYNISAPETQRYTFTCRYDFQQECWNSNKFCCCYNGRGFPTGPRCMCFRKRPESDDLVCNDTSHYP